MSTTPEVTYASVTSSGGQEDERKETADTTPDLRDEKSDEETSATKTDGQEDEKKKTAEPTPDLRDGKTDDETSQEKNEPIMIQLQETDLLLVGKTGNGKSATGNSILWRKGTKSFETSGDSTSLTDKISAEVTEYKGRKIKVVDGPGIGDTRKGTLNIVQKGLQNAIYRNKKGFHAFLIVVRFGGRFTQEDIDAVKLLKGYFGGDTFLKEYCILVITHGDIFKRKGENPGELFEHWCERQKGILKDIIEECNGRVILFDNQAIEEATKIQQLDELLKAVDSLPKKGGRYCDTHFNLAKEGREKAIVNQQKPQINENMIEETSLILEKLEDIHKIADPKQRLEPLNEQKKRADELYKNIKSTDNETGALHEILEAVEAIRRTVHGEFKICQEMITMVDKSKAAEQKIKKKMEQIMKTKEKLNQERMESSHALNLKSVRDEYEREKEGLKSKIQSEQDLSTRLAEQLQTLKGQYQQQNTDLKSERKSLAEQLKKATNKYKTAKAQLEILIVDQSMDTKKSCSIL